MMSLLQFFNAAVGRESTSLASSSIKLCSLLWAKMSKIFCDALNLDPYYYYFQKCLSASPRYEYMVLSSAVIQIARDSERERHHPLQLLLRPSSVIQEYKRVVHAIERFIRKAPPHHRIGGEMRGRAFRWQRVNGNDDGWMR